MKVVFHPGEQDRHTNVQGHLREKILSSSPKTREWIVSSLLKETCKEQGVAEGGSVSLATGGTSLSVTVGGPKQKPAPKFSNESLNQLQLKIGASDNKMNVLGNYLRINCGRDSVSKMDSHMTEQNNKLKNMFDVKYITQTKTTSQKRAENSDESEKNNKKKNKQEVKVEIPVVFAKDTEELACLVMKERNLDPCNTTV